MSDKISLSASMRSTLLNLQNISKKVSLTQNILSTGLKVNSALDNPSSFYTASSLSNRAGDLSALLDSMEQAIQTIQAASTSLEAGASFLEQATAAAAQTLTVSGATEKNTDYYTSQGYTAITYGMDATDIKKLLDSGVKKLVLDGNISLTKELTITQSDIVIEGNGNKITFGGTNSSTVKAAIKVDGGTLDIKNLYMDISGTNNFGIQAINSGYVTIDNTDGITVSDGAGKVAISRSPYLYEGEKNTEIIKDLDNFSDFEAFVAVANHSVIDTAGNIIDSSGWYMCAIGELQQVYNNKNDINIALINAGGDELLNSTYWSSTEATDGIIWRRSMASSDPMGGTKTNDDHLRAFKLFKGFVTIGNNTNIPKVSDIMYKNADGKLAYVDKYSSAPAGYTAIGVVTDVSATGDVTIISLTDLEDPTPETASDTTMKWGPNPSTTDIQNGGSISVIVNSGTISSSFTAFTNTNSKAVAGSKQFKDIINQYDQLINDASYQGVNLLKDNNLSVRFNENNTSQLELKGKDVSSRALGITTLDWESINDVVQVLKEISAALSSIRSYQTELGNNFSIISTRQDFTENLINILTEGADKLTLADMNEESAKMLSLQTRQQLAVNALSLVNQSNKAILQMF